MPTPPTCRRRSTSPAPRSARPARASSCTSACAARCRRPGWPRARAAPCACSSSNGNRCAASACASRSARAASCRWSSRAAAPTASTSRRTPSPPASGVTAPTGSSRRSRRRRRGSPTAGSSGTSSRSGPTRPACPAPPAGAPSVCHDVVPDHGGVAVRVHRGYPVGCRPAGASIRFHGDRTSRRVALTFDDGPGPADARRPRASSAASTCRPPSSSWACRCASTRGSPGRRWPRATRSATTPGTTSR